MGAEQVSDLVGLLRWRARHSPQRLAYTFLVDGETNEVRMTYAELDRQARAIAARLQSLEASGKTVLLLYPPGLDFIAGFFGCLYARAVAVPLYPPRRNRTLHRMEAVVADSQAKVVLTMASIVPKAEAVIRQMFPERDMHWVATDESSGDLSDRWAPPEVRADDLAFIQYTSGSTSEPKGVMVSHSNVLHNQRIIQRAFGQTENSVIVGWLPLHHDMGLIGNVLQPMYTGAACVLMPPLAFLQRPVRWLAAISRVRATTSGGPNFAYDLCVRKIKKADIETLDLSSWEVAFNGAEPIRAESLHNFASTFECVGFRRKAFVACYGLAESTLLVAASRVGAPPTTTRIAVRELEKHRVVATDDSQAGTMELVGCGDVALDHKVVIVESGSLEPCIPGQVGEIWVSGPGVAQGYWNRPEATETTFRARHAGAETGPFLRTGDLGVFTGGNLYVTGRLKDLIIIRGLNYYPQDIELTVARSHPALVPGCGAAFTIEESGQERLVIVHEIDYRSDPNTGEISERIRREIAEAHDIQVFAVLLIKPGGLPKTTSGKLRRQACRTAFLQNRLEAVADWRWAPPSSADTELPIVDDLGPSPETVVEFLVSRLAAHLSIDCSEVNTEQPLHHLGLDSLTAVELTHDLENSLGLRLPIANILEGMSISELAMQALAQVNGSPGVRITSSTPKAVAGIRHRLSYGQRSMYYLYQLAPESAAYNIAAAVRIDGPVSVSSLRGAFESLVQRHALLGATFSTSEGTPYQQVLAAQSPDFEYEDATHWGREYMTERVKAAAYAPFNLEQGPPMRVRVFLRGANEHVLVLALHHIVADLWSLAVVVRELEQLYVSEEMKTPAALPALALRYIDYADWQQRMVSGPEGDRLWSYWQTQLAGPLPVLNLPTDRPRPPIQTYNGCAQLFRVSAELADRLRAVAQAQGATLYMTLLAAFQALLHRYAGQKTIVVGSPAASRNQPGFAGVVGYFVNPIALRAEVSEDQRFSELLGQMRRTVLDGFRNQDYPLGLIVERLQLPRDPGISPLFQVMFSLQKAQPSKHHDLASVALGAGGVRIRLGGLNLQSISLEPEGAQLDLTLSIAEASGGLLGSLQYNRRIFDRPTIARVASHLATLLEGVTSRCACLIKDLPLMGDVERSQVISQWNDTRTFCAENHAENELIHEVIRDRAQQRPDAVAVLFREKQLTYRQLDRSATHAARRLGRLGVGPEVVVGICVERSLEMMVGLLGILKAGGAYLPLDPSYPKERLAFTMADASVPVLLTQRPLLDALPNDLATRTICLDTEWPDIQDHGESEGVIDRTAPWNLAYVIYTSGSTGRPKGVMVSHRNVANFFAGMDSEIGAEGIGTWLSVTSISFDISVLELLWTLSRGFRVVLYKDEEAVSLEEAAAAATHKTMDFSLFFFASDNSEVGAGKYELLMEGAKFADVHGFSAVWTPERHFHAFGGLYPNPSVTGAAVASITKHVQVRAGSVVLPLHHPIRVAEEWSVVDNLSNGRVAISLASGWHADDFVLAPDNYSGRKELLFREIDTVRRLWRGESVPFTGGTGKTVEVKIWPRPVQAELPLWITAAGSPQTFRLAGEAGANLLTHLLGQSLEQLATNIKLYRKAYRGKEGERGTGYVTLMLHTFVGTDIESVRKTVRRPFCNYLASSLDLAKNLLKSLGDDLDPGTLTQEDLQALLSRAFDRYYATSGLFGTPNSCLALVEQLKDIGVDELACLIDFGVDDQAALAGLRNLNTLKGRSNPIYSSHDEDLSLPGMLRRHSVSHMQCTPSMISVLALEPEGLFGLGALERLFLGGEALPAALAADMVESVPAQVRNMYGPTETTIWSSTHRVDGIGPTVPIGRPIANTEFYNVDANFGPMPIGVPGELLIGGTGVVRGYIGRPDLTAERFAPNPFAEQPGARLYRTGDLVRHDVVGNTEFISRMDDQVKIRGRRIELGEIESVLSQHPAVAEAAVVVRDHAPADKRLEACIVPRLGANAARKQWNVNSDVTIPAHLWSHRLPNGMVVASHGGLQTNIIYQEIFEDQVYFKHGVSLRDGDCVFDVGANIGLFTIFVNQRWRRIKSYAFEPISATFELLRANAALYGGIVELFPYGLSDKRGSAEFIFYPEAAGLSGRLSKNTPRCKQTTASIVSSWLRSAVPAAAAVLPQNELDELMEEKLHGEIHTCEMKALSEVIAEYGVERIDLLKIDVEGSEYDVLAGINDGDWPKIDQIVMEIHSRDLRDQVTSLLERREFEIATDEIFPAHADNGLADAGGYVLYAIHPSKRRQQRRDPAGQSITRPQPPCRAQISAAELRAYLKTRLPGFMIPSSFRFLRSLPLSPNGKIERRALRRGDALEGDINTMEFIASDAPPQTAIEKGLASIWTEVLGVQDVGTDDDFFESGGHSLTAAQFVSRARERLNLNVTLRTFLKAPTISGLASALEGASQVDTANGATIPRRPRAGPALLSFAQQRLWFLHQYETGSPAYNFPAALKLTGTISYSALEQSLNEIVRRHEVLRTTYGTSDGQLSQIIGLPSLPLQIVALNSLTATQESDLFRFATEEARSPFDLTLGPVMRARLIRLAEQEHIEQEHILLITLHHIAADGWSLGLVLRELAALYSSFSGGWGSLLPDLSIQYADFATWQRDWLRGERLESMLEYWTQTLGGDVPVVELPTDHLQSSAQDYAGAARAMVIAKPLAESLQALSRQQGATLFMTLLAAFKLLLFRYTNQEDLVIGTPIANRTHTETEGLIGCFVNMLALRSKLNGEMTFRELVDEVRGVALAAYANQELPFEKVIEVLKPNRGQGQAPLFQVTFVFQNIPIMQPVQVQNVRMEPVETGLVTPQYDLTLSIMDGPEELAARLIYKTGLWKEGTIDGMLLHFETLLRCVVAQPDAKLRALEMLTDAEKRQRSMDEKARSEARLRKLLGTKPRAISVSQVRSVKRGYLHPGDTLPLVIQPAIAEASLIGWARDNIEDVDKTLLEHGAILFRGFNIDSVTRFEAFVKIFSPELFEYRERSSPRTDLGGQIYTSTDHPPDQWIQMHSEHTYSHQWPMRLWFCCLQAADKGGETPIASNRKVVELLGPEVIDRFREKRVMYVRNYGDGLGVPWQTAFQTAERSEVERYCDSVGIHFEWKEGDRLRTRQVRDAIINHPATDETSWFNHINIYNTECLESSLRDSLRTCFKEEDLPFNIYYGDGSRIESGVLTEIRAAYNQAIQSFPWRKGDVLMVDNVLVAHGRTPYSGRRRIVVAMGNVVSAQCWAPV
jgi:natural product biosynthesis luciferase-like monooxygenase protein/FkbM family methyltransferase